MKMACAFNPPLNGREVHDKSGANREPHLFSENIASLSQALERFVEVRVERRDLGERVDETVVYEQRR